MARGEFRAAVLILGTVALILPTFSPLCGDEGNSDAAAVAPASEAEFAGATIISKQQSEATPGPLGLGSAPLGHQLVYQTNLRRISRGLAPLKAAAELMEAAQFHSDWMAEHNCFAHHCDGEPSTLERLENAGYLNRTCSGEVVAGGQSTAGEVVDYWMNSPQHHDIILSSAYREAGGGYAFSDSATYHHYWTMDLGARNDAQGNPVYPVVINDEAWSTTNLDVDLYVYGSDWPASQMRFRNEGGSWSSWESFSAHKTWTLSCGGGSLPTVYAQIKKGAVVLESSDEILVDMPLSASPSLLVFLSEEGSSEAIPESYLLEISCCDNWNASANPSWIKLSEESGSGATNLTAYLEGYPSTPGTYLGTISIQASAEQADMQVVLVVTNGALQQSKVPLVSIQRS